LADGTSASQAALAALSPAGHASNAAPSAAAEAAAEAATLLKIQQWAHLGRECPTLAVIAPVEPIVNLDEWGGDAPPPPDVGQLRARASPGQR